MTLLQACPDYVSTIGAYVPPLFVTGVFVIFTGAAGGRIVAKRINSSQMAYGTSLARNWILYVTSAITLILLFITAWITVSYPDNCYRWLFI